MIVYVLYCTHNYHTRRFIGEELILAIGDFSKKFANIKTAILIINNYMDMPTKPLLKMKKL